MEQLLCNQYYCICKQDIIIYGKEYRIGEMYVADEIFGYGNVYYEISSLSKKFVGHMEEYIFDMYFTFLGAVLKEVNIMFNNIMDGK